MRDELEIAKLLAPTDTRRTTLDNLVNADLDRYLKEQTQSWARRAVRDLPGLAVWVVGL